MASSDLTWTEANSPVNRIDEYRVYKSTNVLPTAAEYDDSFSLLATLPVVQNPEPPFGEVHPLEYSDTAVDFSTNFYCYRVDAVSVLVGEATGGSPQTGVGPSNDECVGTPADAATLSGNKVSDNQLDLSWVNGSAGVLPIFSTCVYRSVNLGPFELLAEVFEPTTSYSDTTADNSVNEYSYYVITKDEAGIESDPSNTVEFGFTIDFLIAIAQNDLAATEYNRIITSEDGITWVGSQVQDRGWEDLLFDPDDGDNGRILALNPNADDAVYYSDDGGQTWTPAVTPAVVTGWERFAYSDTLGRFAAISSNASTNGNKIMTSDDGGETWTLRSTPVSMDSLNWSAMIWDPILALFIAGNTAGAGINKIATSADGITWSHISTPTGNGDGVGDDFAIAVGGSFDNRKVGANRGNNSNFHSDDAVTWTNVAVPNGWAGGATGIAYGAGLFVALAGGSTAVETSPDGVTWTNRPLGGPSGSWDEIVYSEELGLFVAVATSGTDKIMTSPDGIVWTARTEPAFANMSWGSVIVAQKPADEARQEMVMSSRALVPSAAGRSTTGASWDESDPGNTVQMDAIAYSPRLGLYMICGGGSPSQFFSSTDAGATWNPVTSGVPGSGSFEIINWSENLDLFIASRSSGGGTQALITCSDGINWVQQTAPNGTAMQDLADSSLAGRAVIVGTNGFTNPTGNVLWTDDGVTFTAPVAAHASNTVRTVVFDTFRDRFVAVQANGECNVSTDNTGTAWTLNINSGDISDSTAFIAYSPELDMLVAATNGGIWSSSDGGANWVLRSGEDTEDVAWSSTLQKFIAIDGSGPPRMLHSADGITWIDQPDPVENARAWSGLALGDVV